MNSTQATVRFRIVVTLALTVALTLGSFWLLEVMRRAGEDVTPAAQRSEPDFFVDNFSYVRMTNDSSARYHISGDRLTHNPVDDSYDVQHPVVNSLKANQAPLTVRAERAKINNDNSKVHLYDNVRISRPPMQKSQGLLIKTEYLLVLPDEDVMQTDMPVDITMGDSKLTGTGMFANNATREFRLSSNVHGTYQAPAH